MTLQKSLENNGTTASTAVGNVATGDPTAEMVETRRQAIEEAAKVVPSNWCDPLLTGPEAVVASPADCPSIERLLNAIRARILKRAANPVAEASALSHLEAAISSAPPSVEGMAGAEDALIQSLLNASRGINDHTVATLFSRAAVTIKAQALALTAAASALSAAPVPPQKGDSMDNEAGALAILSEILSCPEPKERPEPDDMDWRFVALEMKRLAALGLNPPSPAPLDVRADMLAALEGWVAALSVDGVRAMTIDQLAVANGGCITEDLRNAIDFLTRAKGGQP